MISISSETQATPGTRAKTNRIDLPVADWHYIHDAALDLHRCSSLDVALQQLAKFIENGNLGTQLRAVLWDDRGETRLLIPSRQSLDAESSEKIGYQASFDIDLPEVGSLRLSIVLPIDKSIRDQTKMELLLEHFSIAARRLPLC